MYESEWSFQSYPCLAWLWGGRVIPMSIQWMVLLQERCCRQLHLEEDDDDDDIIANDEETIDEETDSPQSCTE